MTFRLDKQGLGELLKSPEMEAEMLIWAKRIRDICVATAPVDPKSPHAGRYKASFRVTSGIQHHKTSRAYGMVINDAPEALAVEYGTRNNPRHRTMGRALDAVREG